MKIKLTYIGKRTADDKIVKAFEDQDGKVYYWSRIKYCVIGRQYYADKKGKSGLTMHTVPEEVEGYVAPEKKITQWEVADALADQDAKRRAFYRKMVKTPEFLKAVDALKPLFKDLRFSQTRMLLEWLADKYWDQS